jgi:hypothetical protein
VARTAGGEAVRVSGGTPHDPAPNLLTGLDPLAAQVADRLPYADQSSELPDDQPVPYLTFRSDPGVGDRLRLVSEPGSRRWDALPVHRLPVDRDLVERSARPVPAPDGVVLVLGIDATRPGPVEAHLERARAELPSAAVSVVNLGDPLRGLDQVAGTGPLLAVARQRRVTAVYWPSFAIPMEAARAALQLAASGIPTVLLDAPDPVPWLHPQLVSDMAPDQAPRLLADELAWASAAAVLRRTAWIEHDLQLRWQPDPSVRSEAESGDRSPTWEPRLTVSPLPTVSVVLATRRPQLVGRAVRSVCAQLGPDVELVLVAHGFASSDRTAAEAQVREHPHGHLVAVPAEVPFGAALNAGVDATSGHTIAKWDDDDTYGPRHLLDLLAARRSSGAVLVGKRAEFVHFEERDVTIWRHPQGAERPSSALAGGTLLIDAPVLAHIGGFAPVSRAVDHHLRVRVERHGLPSFRTHPFGYVLHRHDHGHTWEVDDAWLERGAVARMDGMPAELQVG